MTNEVIPLWPNGAPGSEGWTQVEREDLIPPSLKVIRNVVQPTLTVYLPPTDIATGTAVIVAPGGAFHFLSIDMEGTDVAHWLNAHGVAAFVLRYRLIATSDDFPEVVGKNLSTPGRMDTLQATLNPLVNADGRKAIELVRSHAAEWGIKPDRIGLIGFSAGAMMTLGVVLHHDASSRPDFAAPIYGAGTDEPVPVDAPPLFIQCADDDAMASAASAKLYLAWHAAGHPAELHIYSKGGHGFGMQTKGLASDTWIERFADWMRSEGFAVR
ncbi:MAG TPA: alpha/beta hydrolase [Anaerolineae bacterium]|jgi:acetyl esterase/lipase